MLAVADATPQWVTLAKAHILVDFRSGTAYPFRRWLRRLP